MVTITQVKKDTITDIQSKIFGSRILWQDATKSWRIENARIHKFKGNKETMEFRSFIDTTLLITPDDIFIKDQKAESMPLNELYTAIELEKDRGSGLEEELIKEKYERFAYPFAAVILMIMGFAVSTTKRRGGTPLSIGIGLILSFMYVLLLVTGQAVMGEKMPAWVAIWLPNAIFFLVGLVLLAVARK